MQNLSVNVPSLNHWTPCSLHYSIPNTQYILVIVKLGDIVPLGLLQMEYHETLTRIQREIDQGRGDGTPREIYVRAPDITTIAVRYTRELSPYPPTNQDLIKVFQALAYITASKDHPKPNPPFSRETKFGLTSVNGPSTLWAGKGVIELVETDNDLFARS